MIKKVLVVCVLMLISFAGFGQVTSTKFENVPYAEVGGAFQGNVAVKGDVVAHSSPIDAQLFKLKDGSYFRRFHFLIQRFDQNFKLLWSVDASQHIDDIVTHSDVFVDVDEDHFYMALGANTYVQKTKTLHVLYADLNGNITTKQFDYDCRMNLLNMLVKDKKMHMIVRPDPAITKAYKFSPFDNLDTEDVEMSILQFDVQSTTIKPILVNLAPDKKVLRNFVHPLKDKSGFVVESLYENPKAKEPRYIMLGLSTNLFHFDLSGTLIDQKASTPDHGYAIDASIVQSRAEIDKENKLQDSKGNIWSYTLQEKSKKIAAHLDVTVNKSDGTQKQISFDLEELQEKIFEGNGKNLSQFSSSHAFIDPISKNYVVVIKAVDYFVIELSTDLETLSALCLTGMGSHNGYFHDRNSNQVDRNLSTMSHVSFGEDGIQFGRCSSTFYKKMANNEQSSLLQVIDSGSEERDCSPKKNEYLFFQTYVDGDAVYVIIDDLCAKTTEVLRLN